MVIIRVFKVGEYDYTLFMQAIGTGDLYSDEFNRELESKNLDWEEYFY